MKISTIVGQVIISSLTSAIIIHFATPQYVRETVREMECEEEDKSIIQRLDPSAVSPTFSLSHEEIHKKREEVERNYYKQTEPRKE